MKEAPPLPRLGKYELLGELGRGGMGVVYRAYDRVLEREVALKTMVAPDADQTQTVRFLREAQTAGGLHHPNIVTIYELGQESGTYFIAMELLEGQNLRTVLSSGQLPPVERRLEIVARMCDGLDYAHRAGIVHRDVKPANIFLMSSGVVKILDFGIAKISTSEHTKTGLVLGTVDYMSPEQVRARKNLDGRSDVFSAGVILYELLFRRPPFSADDLGAALHRILHDQPPGFSLFEKVLTPRLAHVLRRSLDKRCEARFARASEMAEALDAAAVELQGRAGTELLERIEEVIAAGVLERSEPATEDELTSNLDVLDRPSGTVTMVGDPPARPRRKALFIAAAVLGAAAAVTTPFLLRGSEEEAAPTVVREETPEVVAPVEAVEESVTENTTDEAKVEQPEPVEPEPVVTENKTATQAPPVAPPPEGHLSLHVMPWATIEWIENLDTGERTPSGVTTPARLQLPAGRYRLRVGSPYVGQPLELETTVRGHETTIVRRTLAGFDPATLAREILAAEEER
ncbi:MAG: protein kinase [Acidobacteria bacterium]|nr:protein kinase [Acidobacteriota bacterium]NIM61711.1 protein kinase [Acidobacteriota bacterium]NIO58193.1 protein kinase [Acidobacteriota bacterium]NIQ83758.1 protein kinase [Acidobacteriota bacterium]NIT09921.1 protein kinase [Acidobacteriota bacterium]